jgi:3-oxoacyl-[acyl-carrier protein] reductase
MDLWRCYIEMDLNCILESMEKIVLITGGSKGIGKAIVLKVSSVYKHVIFTYNSDLNGAMNLTSSIKNSSCYQYDLRNFDKAQEISKEIINTYGGIDILINNAGADRDAIFTKMAKEDWDDVINVNLKSLFNLIHFFLPGMIEKKWGRIINLTSIAAFTGAFGKSNYSAAKAGIIGFTKSLALEVASKGITVNAVAPGAIETDMFLRIPQKYRDKIFENIPGQRLGTPDEVADLISFLISDKASYITGQTIHINGGSFLY